MRQMRKSIGSKIIIFLKGKSKADKAAEKKQGQA